MDKPPQDLDSKAPVYDGKQAHQDAGSNAESGEAELHIDPAKETKLLAKLDIAFTPVIMLVYLVSLSSKSESLWPLLTRTQSCFLDRSNIGTKHISPLDYSPLTPLQEMSKPQECPRT